MTLLGTEGEQMSTTRMDTKTTTTTCQPTHTVTLGMLGADTSSGKKTSEQKKMRKFGSHIS